MNTLRDALTTRQRALLGGTALIGAAAGVYATSIEPRWLQVTRHYVSMPNLPEEWDGVRIAHLTDFHFGSRSLSYETIHAAVTQAVAFAPDLVALTGDFSDRGDRVPLDALAPLVAAAPTFAVPGNHDYFSSYAGADAVMADLTAMEITVLRNDLTAFAHRGVAGAIVGFDDDLRGPGADIETLVARLRGHGPTLALAHEPDVAARFPHGWAGLTLAGHTHGAQVRLSPLRDIDWVSLRLTDMHSAYLRGWYTVNGNRLYVNHGIGTTKFSVRFAARPELALFTLTHTS